jgi:YVTN family beta-propeller protein
MNGNSAISLFDTGNNTVIENYFFSQNNTSLGDVAQSMNKINNDYYIVVNNSNKIVVCDENFKVKRTINGLISPRYIQQVSNQKAYVSDLYANAISIIDLNNGVKTGSISCPGKTERMVMLYNKVYVTNYDRDKVYVIDATIDKIIDSVYVGLHTSSLVLDKNDKLWVASGESSVTITFSIKRINPVDLSTEGSFGSLSSLPNNLCINGSKDTLFFLSGDVYKMAISDAAGTKIVPKGPKNFYGLAVHPTTHDIYVADALDYVQKSTIYIYNSATGAEKQHFKAGINANGFYFE